MNDLNQYFPIIIMFGAMLINSFSISFFQLEKRIQYFINILLFCCLFAFCVKSSDFYWFGLIGNRAIRYPYLIILSVSTIVSILSVEIDRDECEYYFFLVPVFCFFNFFLIMANDYITFLLALILIDASELLSYLVEGDVRKTAQRDLVLGKLLTILILGLSFVFFTLSTDTSSILDITVMNSSLFKVSTILFILYVVIKIGVIPFHFVNYKILYSRSHTPIVISHIMGRVISIPFILIFGQKMLISINPVAQEKVLIILKIFILLSAFITVFKIVKLRNTLRIANYLYLFNLLIFLLFFFYVEEIDTSPILPFINLTLLGTYLTLILIERMAGDDMSRLGRVKGLLRAEMFWGFIYVVSLLLLWGLPLSSAFESKFEVIKNVMRENMYIFISAIIFLSMAMWMVVLNSMRELSLEISEVIEMKSNMSLRVTIITLFILIFLINFNFSSWKLLF